MHFTHKQSQTFCSEQRLPKSIIQRLLMYRLYILDLREDR